MQLATFFEFGKPSCMYAHTHTHTCTCLEISFKWLQNTEQIILKQ